MPSKSSWAGRGKFRIYLIGLAMGIADLIPGVSGGTIAFITGIYDQWLESIKTIQFQSIQKIAWPFLLPLGGGIVTSIFLFAQVFYFLMQNYQAPLFGLFFGFIAASTWISAKSAQRMCPSHLLALLIGFALSFWLTSLPARELFATHFFWIMLAGILGVGAMLLPGISGSYILQILGVYPFIMKALQSPLAPGSFSFLLALGSGIALGFVLFSRLISFLLSRFHQVTLATMIGFMAGGLKAVWPFGMGSIIAPLACSMLGFFVIIILEISTKRLKVSN